MTPRSRNRLTHYDIRPPGIQPRQSAGPWAWAVASGRHCDRARGQLFVTSRLRLEARTSGQHNQPHVVSVLDFGAYEDLHFPVMKPAQGDSLARWLTGSSPLPAERMARTATQAASGLTATGEIIDTSPCPAPQRALTQSTAPASDMPLGCVLHQLITGRPLLQPDTALAVPAPRRLPHHPAHLGACRFAGWATSATSAAPSTRCLPCASIPGRSDRLPAARKRTFGPICSCTGHRNASTSGPPEERIGPPKESAAQGFNRMAKSDT